MDKPFVTDGCTLVTGFDQHTCCMLHDWTCWKGGSSRDRREADYAFFKCIVKNSKFPVLAPIRWLGVRIGGKKFRKAPGVSWNYGWNDFKWRDEGGPITEASQREKLRRALEDAAP
jgi:hypothetical protein